MVRPVFSASIRPASCRTEKWADMVGLETAKWSASSPAERDRSRRSCRTRRRVGSERALKTRFTFLYLANHRTIVKPFLALAKSPRMPGGAVTLDRARTSTANPAAGPSRRDRHFGPRGLQRSIERVEAALPTPLVIVAMFRAGELFVRQDDFREFPALEEFHGDQGLLVFLHRRSPGRRSSPGPGEDQLLRRADFPIGAFEHVDNASRRDGLEAIAASRTHVEFVILGLLRRAGGAAHPFFQQGALRPGLEDLLPRGHDHPADLELRFRCL